MPPSASARDRTPAGYAGNIEELVSELAAVLVDQRNAHAAEAGPPWRSKRLTQREALTRMDQWDQPTPSIVKFAGNLSDGQLAAAALEAVKLRAKAMAAGEWSPPATAAVPPQGAALALQAAAGEAKPFKAPSTPPPTREIVGGQRVLEGAAQLERHLAAGAGLGAPTTQAEILRSGAPGA